MSNWNEPNLLIPITSKLHSSIQNNPAAWLYQTAKIECNVKYINIRVDQRTGHFTLFGDKTPEITFPVCDVPHFFKNGWTYKDGVNHGLVSAVTEINKDVFDNLLSKDKMKLLAKIIEKHIAIGVQSRTFPVHSSKGITIEQFSNYWK